MYEGEFGVFIRCPWRLERGEALVCGSDDDSEVIKVGLSKLIGERIEATSTQRHSWDLVITFSSGYNLRAFCSRVQGDLQYDDNWQIWSGELDLIVGPGNHCRIEERDG